ncbi:hypothetical protein RRG08_065131 [Elysia crispata]|uniref:Uncharacterized protein n=1 Tax=Elysia crispata TaxID=231223 RepID=A0AAE1DCX8_9GAST|nr:hypothetical protein RRG08_065131 [Elysia crispata]
MKEDNEKEETKERKARKRSMKEDNEKEETKERKARKRSMKEDNEKEETKEKGTWDCRKGGEFVRDQRQEEENLKPVPWSRGEDCDVTPDDSCLVQLGSSRDLVAKDALPSVIWAYVSQGPSCGGPRHGGSSFWAARLQCTPLSTSPSCNLSGGIS